MSVITLGQLVKQPLMRASSELSYGLEPHALFLLPYPGAAVLGAAAAWGGVYPGWGAGWGTGRVHIPGTNPAGQIEAYLT